MELEEFGNWLAWLGTFVPILVFGLSFWMFRRFKVWVRLLLGVNFAISIFFSCSFTALGIALRDGLGPGSRERVYGLADWQRNSDVIPDLFGMVIIFASPGLIFLWFNRRPKKPKEIL
jgi:hypothetical protein